MSKSAACVLAVVLGTSCTTLSVDFQEAAESAWSMHGADGTRAGGAAFVAGDSLHQVWLYNANAGFGPGSPVQVGEALVFGTRRGEIHAVRIEDGRRFGSSRFGETIDGTPVVDGPMVYIPVGRHTRKGLKAFDLRGGTERWARRMGAVETGVLQAGESLFVVEESRTLHRIAARTGEGEWSVDLSPYGRVRAAPVLGPDDTVLMASVEGDLAAFDRSDGSLRWRRSLGAPVYETPALSGPLLFVPTTRGVLLAVEAASGSETWRYEAGGPSVRVTSPTVLGATLAVAATNGRVARLRSRDGAPVWAAQLSEPVGAPPLHLEDAVLVGTLGRSLLMLDGATGEIRWSAEISGRMKSAMAATEAGIFVLAEPGSAYRFTYAGAVVLADGG